MTEQNENAAETEVEAKTPEFVGEQTEAPKETSSEKTETEKDEAKPDAKAEKQEREPWFVKRIAELTRQNADRDRALQQAEQRLREFQPQAEPQQAQQPDVQTLAEQRAQAIVARREFDSQCNAAHEAGVREYPDFAVKMTALGQAGGLPNALVEAALETGEAHKVLYQLGQDPELAMQIRDLSPTRMGVALARLAASSAPVAVSKAPAPIRSIGGGSAKVNDDPERMSMQEYSAWRAKQIAGRK